MPATLIIEEKVYFPDGSLVELVAWHVPHPVVPARHRYKYRLVYIVNGKRVLGYDNERGKGDHRHHRSGETAVTFTTLAALVEQFLTEVDGIRRDS